MVLINGSGDNPGLEPVPFRPTQARIRRSIKQSHEFTSKVNRTQIRNFSIKFTDFTNNYREVSTEHLKDIIPDKYHYSDTRVYPL